MLKFGRLTPCFKINNSLRNIWLFKCSCGVFTIKRYSHVQSGATKSCGCLNKELCKIRSTIHGHTSNGKWTSEYNTWSAMYTRCYCKKHKQYKDYGGRGIRVCKRWKNNFVNFIKDMGLKPSKNYQIDRINNDKGYYPNNCRWVTSKQNCNNTRKQNVIKK